MTKDEVSPSLANESLTTGAAEPWILRIIDANANRAAEGLRVVEEFLRFRIQDRSLSQRCKGIRHEVSTTVATLAAGGAVSCRSTTTDVGVTVVGAQEYQRSSPIDVVVSNLKRSQQALRVLEEYGKLASVDIAKKFESLRYETYTLEKSFHHLLEAQQRLKQVQLYVLVDEQFGFDREFDRRVDRLLQAGVDAIQLRAKTATDRVILEISRRLKARCGDAGVIYIVNDRADIARAVHADGVHVGQDELPVADVRAIVGSRMLVGVSTHSTQQAVQAVRDGADYIGVGPVFSSKTKAFNDFVGLDLVKWVAQNLGLPAFPIGGIQAGNLASLLQVGANRVALSHAIWQAEDIELAVGEFRSLLQSVRESLNMSLSDN